MDHLAQPPISPDSITLVLHTLALLVMLINKPDLPHYFTQTVFRDLPELTQIMALVSQIAMHKLPRLLYLFRRNQFCTPLDTLPFRIPKDTHHEVTIDINELTKMVGTVSLENNSGANFSSKDFHKFFSLYLSYMESRNASHKTMREHLSFLFCQDLQQHLPYASSLPLESLVLYFVNNFGKPSDKFLIHHVLKQNVTRQDSESFSDFSSRFLLIRLLTDKILGSKEFSNLNDVRRDLSAFVKKLPHRTYTVQNAVTLGHSSLENFIQEIDKLERVYSSPDKSGYTSDYDEPNLESPIHLKDLNHRLKNISIKTWEPPDNQTIETILNDTTPPHDTQPLLASPPNQKKLHALARQNNIKDPTTPPEYKDTSSPTEFSPNKGKSSPIYANHSIMISHPPNCRLNVLPDSPKLLRKSPTPSPRKLPLFRRQLERVSKKLTTPSPIPPHISHRHYSPPRHSMKTSTLRRNLDSMLPASPDLSPIPHRVNIPLDHFLPVKKKSASSQRATTLEDYFPKDNSSSSDTNPRQKKRWKSQVNSLTILGAEAIYFLPIPYDPLQTITFGSHSVPSHSYHAISQFYNLSLTPNDQSSVPVLSSCYDHQPPKQDEPFFPSQPHFLLPSAVEINELVVPHMQAQNIEYQFRGKPVTSYPVSVLQDRSPYISMILHFSKNCKASILSLWDSGCGITILSQNLFEKFPLSTQQKLAQHYIPLGTASTHNNAFITGHLDLIVSLRSSDTDDKPLIFVQKFHIAQNLTKDCYVGTDLICNEHVKNSENWTGAYLKYPIPYQFETSLNEDGKFIPFLYCSQQEILQWTRSNPLYTNPINPIVTPVSPKPMDISSLLQSSDTTFLSL